MPYYPVCLNLEGRPCVVVGGGRVAEVKVRGLLAASAAVTVVGPYLTRELQQLADTGQITHVPRAYHRGDLAGTFLAVSATDDRIINQRVWEEAVERDILINVVDDPSHCSFTVPSIVRRGDLAIAISTGGKAPALAVRLRQQLDTTIGPEYARFLELAGTLRVPLAVRYPDFQRRKVLWYQLVDSDVLALLRQGDEPAARRRIAEIMGIAPGES